MNEEQKRLRNRATQDTPVSRAEIMLALHDEGAFCGWCDFEDAIFDDRSNGVEWRCKDCERHLGNYVDAILTLFTRETVEAKDECL